MVLSLNCHLVSFVYFLWSSAIATLKNILFALHWPPTSLALCKCAWSFQAKSIFSSSERWKMHISDQKVKSFLGCYNYLILNILNSKCSVSITFKWMINLHKEIVCTVKPSYIWSTSTAAQCQHEMMITRFQ